MQETIERIRRMERLFDEVSASGKIDAQTQKKVETLSAYMDSGQWLQDYHLDELGMLPPELKRGVLSEDGLYHLLADIMEKERDE
ncbi:MAG: DUF4298 domain-containing protein [Clostridia bacterium]|nr:DUF4298 domain-containing protein [Clostridia bacterium]